MTVPKGAGGRPDRYPRLAAELLRAQVDVIVAAGPALRALKEAAVTIPVVMAASPIRWTRGWSGAWPGREARSPG